jgi:hypothetical protein
VLAGLMPFIEISQLELSIFVKMPGEIVKHFEVFNGNLLRPLSD